MPRPSPIKAACAERGLSIADLARELGYTANTLRAVASGVSAPWPELRRRLTAYFGYDPLGEAENVVAS